MFDCMQTHTMGSGNNADLYDEELGIIPRVCRHIFAKKEELEAEADITVKVAYIEIYNEEVRDLLNPTTPSKQVGVICAKLDS